MVNPSSVKYELNHTYTIVMGNAAIPIGQAGANGQSQLTLFEKSLALTSDLKRLPILRSIATTPQFINTLAALLTASGVTTAVVGYWVINEEISAAEWAAVLALGPDEIAKHQVLFATEFYTKLNGAVHEPFFAAPTENMQGGILLNNVITVIGGITTNVVVAGAAFPYNSIQQIFWLEIDWAPVTKEEFQNYILEHVYASE